jgi:hypothetical protein
MLIDHDHAAHIQLLRVRREGSGFDARERRGRGTDAPARMAARDHERDDVRGGTIDDDERPCRCVEHARRHEQAPAIAHVPRIEMLELELVRDHGESLALES